MAKTYVCPGCNEVVAAPIKDVKKKAVLRCPAGHKVHEAGLSFPGAFVAGFFAGVIVWLLTWYVPGWIRQLASIAMLFRFVFIVYSFVIVVRGLTWISKANPTRGLGMHSLGVGSGSLVGLGMTAALYWTGFHKLTG
jgi:hypothetical protein